MLTFEAGGALTRTISVAIVDDAEDEPEESFAVVLGTASLESVTVSDGEGTGTITDNDLPTVSLAARAESETEDDDLDEPDGSVEATLFAAETFSVSGSGNAVTAILDNDEMPELTITGSTAAEDGGAVEFEVRLDAASAQQVRVDYATADGTATAGMDYTTAQGTLVLNAGDTLRTIEVAVTDDTEDEADSETFTVTLSQPRNVTLAGGGTTLAATGTITDDDLPVVGLGAAPGPVEEGDEVRFTLTRAGDLTPALSVPVTVTLDGGFFSGTPPSSVVFDPGASEAALVVATVEDELDESDGSVIFTLTDGSAYLLPGRVQGALSATASVRDDDPPLLTIADERGAESCESLTFSVGLSGPSAREVTVDYAVTDATATAGMDYTADDGTLTFAAGVTERTITVAIENDNLDEPPEETFTVALSGAVNARGSPSATGTIEDDDGTPELTVADGTVAESAGSLEFTLALSAPSALQVSATYVDGGRDGRGGGGLRRPERCG